MITVIYSDGSQEDLNSFSEIQMVPGSGGYFVANGKRINSVFAELDYFEMCRRMFPSPYAFSVEKYATV